MTSLAVKILRDEDGNEFVPYTSTNALYDPDGETISDKIAKKLETSSLIAGTGITLIPDMTNHTVEIQSNAPGANLINSLTTSVAGQGALDAYQGYLLNNKIPTEFNQLNNRITDLLSEPKFGDKTTITNKSLFMMTKANRLAFLPADQIIIEQSIDGGTTWTDAGISDDAKRALFSGRNNGAIYFPMKDGKRTTDALFRITFTAMKYNVPADTAETDKYNYWNGTYVQGAERYSTLDTLYFWVSSATDRIWVKLERASGAEPNNWYNIFDTSTDANRVGLEGWPGMGFITFNSDRFGGAKTQTTNFWNYRLTFRTCSNVTTSDATLFDDANLSTSYNTQPQQILGISGYGDNCWDMPYELGKTDHMYSWDIDRNVTFPAKLTASSLGVQSIELSSSTPSIDFHYNNSSADYTSRIIETSSGTLSMLNNLTISGLLTTGSQIRANTSSGESSVGASYNGNAIYLYSNSDVHGIYDTTYGNIIYINANGKSFDGSANWANGAAYANYLYGFTGRTTSQTWGNQTGTFITGMDDSTGGSMAFRRDNPTSGQMSMIIDGRYYQREGQQVVLDASNFSYSNGTLYITTT